MTSTRIVSGLVFGAVFLLGLFNRTFFWIPPIAIWLAALWGVREFTRLGSVPLHKFGLAVAFVGATALLGDAYLYGLAHGLMVLATVSVLAIGGGLLARGPDAASTSGRIVAAVTYVALPLALAIRIWRGAPGEAGPIPDAGVYLLIFLIAVTWAGDVGAYFFGRWFGKHKLAPRLSPGKTIEGLAGGIGFTLVVACALKIFWPQMAHLFGWLDVVILSLAFSIIGPIGDLAESHMKRSAQVKDSGQTFTGHGGMLDIIDSLLFTSVFYAVYLALVHPWVFS